MQVATPDDDRAPGGMTADPVVSIGQSFARLLRGAIEEECRRAVEDAVRECGIPEDLLFGDPNATRAGESS